MRPNVAKPENGLYAASFYCMFSHWNRKKLL